MRSSLSSTWNRSREWFEQTYKSSHFWEVLKTASAEIAVLLFVFPLIDMLGSESVKRRHWPLVLCSFGVGLAFILLAGFFARLEHENDEEL